jgi:phenylalanyl-tRNA synthetase beta subunit
VCTGADKKTISSGSTDSLSIGSSSSSSSSTGTGSSSVETGMQRIAKEVGDIAYKQASTQIANKVKTESVKDKNLNEQVNRIKKLMNL